MPRKWESKSRTVWKASLESEGLAGIAASNDFVFLNGRNLDDTKDVCQCLDAADGAELWNVTYPAKGQLDYGNSPRATPYIHDEIIFFQGAFGDLHAVDLESGEVVWSQNFYKKFETKVPTWGACASPLVADGKLIVTPGAKAASLLALDPATGEVIWQTAGRESGYGSFIVATLGGVAQVVGHDSESLGGWDLKTGRRLWELIPSRPGDFNVPTPVIVNEGLAVMTENNGSRIYGFDNQGRIQSQPLAVNLDLASDTTTPVVVGDTLIGCDDQLVMLDLQHKLKLRAKLKTRDFRGHASLIAGPDSVLVVGHDGTIHLVEARQHELRITSKFNPFDEPVEIYSHPALVRDRLYVRGGRTLLCVDLSES